MKFFKSIIGYFLAGFTVTMFWGKFTLSFGLLGGWLAAFFLVGPMWYINHHHNFVSNKKDAVFIDMGLAIAVCNLTVGLADKKLSYQINSIYTALPTLIFLGLGAVCGVVAALYAEKQIYKLKTKDKINE